MRSRDRGGALYMIHHIFSVSLASPIIDTEGAPRNLTFMAAICTYGRFPVVKWGGGWDRR
uniref:Uncharacterized protein n=1 Tax=mine drainage metagenome TaxID=410659 RepID=E6PIU5_9ZZZZ